MLRKKIKQRLLLFGALLLIGFSILFYSKENVIERRFTENTSLYDAAQWEIQANRNRLEKIFNEDNYRSSEGVNVDFRIGNNDMLQLKGKLSAIRRLFRKKLAEEVLILQNGNILFKLKQCQNQDCINTKYDGIYSHYFTKDRAHFIHERWIKIIYQERFGEWTYYIIRTPMG